MDGHDQEREARAGVDGGDPGGPRSGPVQDHYPDEQAHCYGCGRLNRDGLHIQTIWHDGGEAVARFRPRPYHTALPGIVYGGLIASLIDCHSTGTAAAAVYHSEDRAYGSDPPVRFVTAALHVDYLRPTPLDAELEVRARIEELTGRKAVVATSLTAEGEECARGRVVVIRLALDQSL